LQLQKFLEQPDCNWPIAPPQSGNHGRLQSPPWRGAPHAGAPSGEELHLRRRAVPHARKFWQLRGLAAVPKAAPMRSHQATQLCV
jgi:hypothetical protein